MFLLLFFFSLRVLYGSENHFRGSFKKYADKYCKVAPRSTSSFQKVDWLLSYFHACHDEITYFNEAFFFFQYGYYAMVESSMQGKF